MLQMAQYNWMWMGSQPSNLVEKIKESFNANRFQAAETLLDGIIDEEIDKKAYYKRS